MRLAVSGTIIDATFADAECRDFSSQGPALLHLGFGRLICDLGTFSMESRGPGNP